MRNLKKILSLALALVMVMSLLTVAGAREFNDAADIEHTEAVEVMSALGVINGKGNNTFDPKGNVTRAEMAKMITYICLGNVEPTAFLGTQTNLTDINGHWAEAYIKYCYSQGIISGRGNGIFDPNASVTATEAARMLLVAIGYNADVQVYTGAQWAINVVRDAQISKLYDDVSVMSNEVLNRDKASQMMYNALTTKSVTKTASQSITTGDIIWEYNPNGEPLLKKSFDAQVWVGDFTGNHDFNGGGAAAGEIVVNGRIEGATKSDGTPANPAPAKFPYDYDIANIGEEVKVIFKDGTSGTRNQPDKNDTIYGVYKTNGTSVVNATRDNVGDQKNGKAQIKVSGTTYDTLDAVDVIFNFNDGDTNSAEDVSAKRNNANSDLTNALKAQKSDAIKLVFDNDGKVERVYVTEYTLGKVTSVVSGKATVSGVGAIELDKNDVYSGIAKDDVVVYTRYYSSSSLDDAYFVVTPAEVISGDITAYDAVRSGEQKKVSVDGTSYKIYNKVLATNLTDDYMTDLADGESIGTKIHAYMINGMVGALQETSEGEIRYALVISDNNTQTLGVNTGRVQLLLPDGTKASYDVDEKSTLQADDIDGTKTLVHYTVKNNGSVSMEAASGSKSSVTDIWNKDTKQVATSGVASSDCVLFATISGSEKVYNIRDLDSITASSQTVTFEKKGGQIVAVYATLSSTPAGDSSTRYGLVLSKGGVEKIGDDYFRVYTIWTGEAEEKIFVDRSATVNPLEDGKMYKFDLTNNRQYDNYTNFVELTDGAHGDITVKDVAVKEHLVGDKVLVFYNSTALSNGVYSGVGEDSLGIDDDVHMIYVNAYDKKAGNDLGEAVAFNSATGYANAKLVVDGGKIVAIFVATNYDYDVNGTKTVLKGAVSADTSAEIKDQLVTDETAQITSGTNTVDTEMTVGANQSVTYTANTTVSADQTVQGTASFKDVALNANLTVSGSTTIDGTVNVAAGKKISVENNGTVTLKGNATLADTPIEVKAGGKLVLDGSVNALPKVTGAGVVEIKKDMATGDLLDDDPANNVITPATNSTPLAKDASVKVETAASPKLTGNGSTTYSSLSMSELAQPSGSTYVTLCYLKLTGLTKDDVITGTVYFTKADGTEDHYTMVGAGGYFSYSVTEEDANNGVTFAFTRGEKVTKVVYTAKTGDTANGTYTFTF